MVPSSGLLNWWSDLINRTDLERKNENEPPVKPKMSGNIQMIFYMLQSGLVVALTCMVLESHEYIVKQLQHAFSLCAFVLLRVVQWFKHLYPFVTRPKQIIRVKHIKSKESMKFTCNNLLFPPDKVKF